MTRVEKWQSALESFLESRRNLPFAWGSNDCCTFACSGVLAVCGYDPADGLREHRTAAEGAATLNAYGGIEKLANERLGPKCSALAAAAGDVGLLVVDRRKSLVLCAGSHWVGPSSTGLTRYPFENARRAWRCERA